MINFLFVINDEHFHNLSIKTHYTKNLPNGGLAQELCCILHIRVVERLHLANMKICCRALSFLHGSNSSSTVVAHNLLP